MSLKRKEEFEMIRNTVTGYNKHLGFLLCSSDPELRFASRCPEMMHGKEPVLPGD